MTRLRPYFFLFCLGLITTGSAALFQSTPGYMDAEYYFSGGVQLASGEGFREPFIWNYLGGEAVLPARGAASFDHPSHAYWLPLASLVAALGMLLTGSLSFRAAQLGFVLAAALIPPLTMALARDMLRERFRPDDGQRISFYAGLLAVFPGFYLAYLPTADTFGITMLLGGGWFLALGRPDAPRKGLRLFGMGILAGALHLARAEGVIWFGLSLGAVLWYARARRMSPLRMTGLLALVVAGYLLVAGPWMLRNLSVFGVALAPGGIRALWLTQYDELYAYPPELLTPARWWASGLAEILSVRLAALWANLQTTLVVQGQIFLLPLALLGGWHLRADRRLWLASAAWLTSLGMMSVAFPFAGARGGFFHSGATLQPIWWGLAAAGLDVMVAWGNRHRSWQPRQAQRFFSTGFVLLALVMSLFLFNLRVLGGQPAASPVWDAPLERYARLEGALQAYRPQPGDRVLVNNPPGYFLAAGRQAAAIPFGDEKTVLAVADRLGVRYLLLEIDQIQGSSIYTRPEDRPGLRYLGTTTDGVRIYEFTGYK